MRYSCRHTLGLQDKLMMHRLEHVQLLQQRLGFTIKRSNNDELSGKLKMRRVIKKRERRMHSCPICCFRCDSVQAYIVHKENHGASAIFKCSLCNYANNTANVVLFHEEVVTDLQILICQLHGMILQNHHLEGALTDICNSNDRLKSVGYHDGVRSHTFTKQHRVNLPFSI